MKRGRAFAGKGHLRLKAGCLDLRTDSLVFFFPEKAFLIKKSALLTTICCENIQIVSTYGKKQFTGGWAGIAVHQTVPDLLVSSPVYFHMNCESDPLPAKGARGDVGNFVNLSFQRHFIPSEFPSSPPASPEGALGS